MNGSSPVSGGAAAGGAGGLGDVLWSVIQASQLSNEVMNFPGIEGADGAQPEWWEAAANCTLTEEDVAGEAITENYERALKVVTTANSYAYQRYTYADQPRIKSGRTLSAMFAVWSVAGVAARIRLQSSVGSLGVSADTTAAAWTIVMVEGVTLDGTRVDIQLEVDNGTAYFVPLGISIGAKAVPLKPRGLRYAEDDGRTQIINNTTAHSLTWQDIDLTANTSPLAARAEIQGDCARSAAGQSHFYVRRNGSGTTGPGVRICTYGTTPGNEEICFHCTVLLDDSNIFEYTNNGDPCDEDVFLAGWWEWE